MRKLFAFISISFFSFVLHAQTEQEQPVSPVQNPAPTIETATNVNQINTSVDMKAAEQPQLSAATQASITENKPAEPVCFTDLASLSGPRAVGFIQYMSAFKKDTPRMMFKTGESPYQLYRLPEYKKPYRIEISLVFMPVFGREYSFFLPSAIVLDEKFCPVEEYFKLNYEFTQGVFAPPVEKAFMPVDSNKPRYVLVFTDAEILGKYAVVVSPGFFTKNERKIKYADTGFYNIRINK